MFVLHLFAAFATIYVLFSLVLCVRLSWLMRILLSLIVIGFGLKYVIYSYVGGILDPKLSPLFVLILEAGHSVLFLMVILAILKDIYFLIHFFATRKKRKKQEFALFNTRKPKPRFTRNSNYALVITVVSLALGIYGTVSQLQVPKVVEQEIYIDNLPSELEGYSVVQLTDLHIGPILKGDFLSGVVDKVNELNADLVAISGDFVDGSVSRHKQEFTSLANLKATNGVYAVTGNHEYYSGVTSWVKVWERLGVKFLNDESMPIYKGSARIQLAGITDPVATGSYDSIVFPDKVKNDLASSHADLKILLSHRPSVAKLNPKADLILSGHTHGGTMFFLKPFIAYFNGGFVSGLYDLESGSKLYVSNGTGIWSGFSCRIFVPAEITRFTFHATPKS